jgi:hypothetical protein
MLHLTCKLTFPDGATVIGQLSGRSAEALYPVSYSGAVKRLPRRYPKADAGLLKTLFRNVAQETGAEIDINQSGTFERWAE